MTQLPEIEVNANPGRNGSVTLSFIRTDIPFTQVAKCDFDTFIESVETYFIWVQTKFSVNPYYDRKQLRQAWKLANIPPLAVPEVTIEHLDVWKNVEVDLTEALTGWKCWSVGVNQLVSQSDTIWYPDKPQEAVCTNKSTNHTAPSPGCMCGIHGATDRETAKGYGEILGEVYGWGRYCRHEHGWRAQFAYPKAFLLNADQVTYIEWLRDYHVPIFILQPTLIYNPEEDGYEYRTTEAYWNIGTGKDTITGEEGGTSQEGDYEG